MHGPDGTDYPNYIFYTKIDAPRLIANDHGSRKGEPSLFKGSVTFEAKGEKTLVTLSLKMASCGTARHVDDLWRRPGRHPKSRAARRFP